MKILHVSHSDAEGGAARAAYRIHEGLRQAGSDSTMLVLRALSGYPDVQTQVGDYKKLYSLICQVTGDFLGKTQRNTLGTLHSAALLPSPLKPRVDAANADLVHLHWIGGETLSIGDVAKIRQPVVWSLHDMWAFTGSAHYAVDDRWRTGYLDKAGDGNWLGLDLDRWVWRRKSKHWTKPMPLIVPGSWMKSCIEQSKLMQSWPVHVVPYPIDTSWWRPLRKDIARQLLGLPIESSVILFGSYGVGQDPRKGFDLLTEALDELSEGDLPIHLAIFGGREPSGGSGLPFPATFLGPVKDNTTLKLLYSAADVLALPSRQDNFPLTGIEAMACGCPVVGFDSCGMPDLISHKESGYLARSFDSLDFAQGISWCLGNEGRSSSFVAPEPAAQDGVYSDFGERGTLSLAARDQAEGTYSYDVVIPKIQAVYDEVASNAT